MEYLWDKEEEKTRFPELSRDEDVDVLVIGGGIAGVLCALSLKEAGVKYLLLEGKRVGEGITRGTTAVLTAQHDLLYQDMIKKFGAEKAKLYLNANLNAVERFAALSKQVDCDFERMDSFMYSLKDRELMEKEARAVQSLGFAAELTDKTPLPFAVAGAVRFPNMAQFHPLKFLRGISKTLRVYENTFVKALEGTTAVTEKGRVHAKKVIVATHFPFVNRHGLYFMKLYQQRSFVIALENAPELGCTIMDAAENGIYMRNYHGLLLIGGGDGRTGEKSGGFAVPRAFAKRYFPDAREKFAWANQDCVSLDGLPYIGAYSPSMENVYVATGFNLWGVTTAMAGAQVLTDAVLGRENPYASVFSPNRSMASMQILKNMGTTVSDFVVPTTKRCSHLGCALKWNAAEHSWDCPCHGSRFDQHGALMDNPAMRDSHVE